MATFKVTFNSLDIPSFVKVRAVDFTALPEINNKFIQVGGGIGMLEAGTNTGGKIIKLSVVIVPDYNKSLQEMARTLAGWLSQNKFKTCTLVISDDSNMTYKAKVNNNVDINDLLYVGEGDIEFIVPSGMGYGATLTDSIYTTATSSSQDIIRFGTAPAYPVITWTPRLDYTNAVLEFNCTQTGVYLTLTGNFNIGEEIVIDCKNKVVKRVGVVEMKLLNYASDWLTFPNAGTYTLNCNRSGTVAYSLVEYWY
jgi:predicted phage tail component-like protein